MEIRKKFKYTDDAIAIILIVSYVVTQALSLPTIPTPAFYGALGWTFGKQFLWLQSRLNGD